MKPYIIPQTDLVYCKGLMASDQPSMHNEYQGEGNPQLSPARTLKYL